MTREPEHTAAADAVSDVVAGPGERAGPAHPPSEGPAGTDTEAFSVSLPFLRVSLSRRRADEGGAPLDEQAATAPSGPAAFPGWLFYGGVAALGLAGVLEWPAAAAIAAGSYVAGRVRGRQ